jgi:O-antigen/teichoic acid export membrane protein
MLKNLRYLAGQSAIYGVGTLVTQAIGVLLVPLYVQLLPPDNYGVLGITSSVTSILVSVFLLGLPSAALRFYFDTSDDQRRRTILGTTLLTSLLIIAILVIVLLVVGPLISRYAFPDIPFYPLLVLAIFIAVFQSLRSLPLAFFRARENAALFVFFSVGIFLLTTLFSILFVATFRWGVNGALVARLAAYAIGAIAATILLFRYTGLHFQSDIARTVILFGLPLVPSGLAGWLLDLSDRVVMQGFISLNDIGIYTLGYQLGNAVSMLSTAINSAWSPFYYRTFQEHPDQAPKILAPIITYFMMITILVGLATSLFAPEIIHLLARPDYQAAHTVVPWIAASSVVQVFNWITRQGLMHAKKTYWDPPLYLLGGGTNIVLNLLLLPRFGYIAGGWTTLIGFALMGTVMFAISQRVRPMVYEYKRLGILTFLAIGVFFVSRWIPSDSTWVSLAIKLGLLGFYPVFLWVFGFVSVQERKALVVFWNRIRGVWFEAKDKANGTE